MAGTLWLDFDGTLAYRPSMWAEACLDVLDELVDEHDLSHAALEGPLSIGMPWHDPATPHDHLDTPDLWWDAVALRAQEAVAELGVQCSVEHLRAGIRRRITDPSRYQLFDDTLDALELIGARGWRSAVVSNHIPELGDVCDGLGISSHVDWVLTSGLTGYEKPHDAVIDMALALTAAQPVWMVGDSVEADCIPAVRRGLGAVLVRRADHAFQPRHDTLLAAVDAVCT